jgi:hypothetical protein
MRAESKAEVRRIRHKTIGEMVRSRKARSFDSNLAARASTCNRSRRTGAEHVMCSGIGIAVAATCASARVRIARKPYVLGSKCYFVRPREHRNTAASRVDGGRFRSGAHEKKSHHAVISTSDKSSQLQLAGIRFRLDRRRLRASSIRRHRICRLRLTLASGISAWTELWPSG